MALCRTQVFLGALSCIVLCVAPFTITSLSS